MEGTGLKKKDLKRFREILLAKKKEILRNAQRTLNEDMTLDADDLPDEMDLASSEYLHSFTFRLRGREKVFLQKIDHALEKIKEGTFGVCEQCGEPISLKRLEARLETTLCIRCKEDQERIEKAYGEVGTLKRSRCRRGKPAWARRDQAPSRWRSSCCRRRRPAARGRSRSISTARRSGPTRTGRSAIPCRCR